jgi:hypothetical protein
MGGHGDMQAKIADLMVKKGKTFNEVADEVYIPTPFDFHRAHCSYCIGVHEDQRRRCEDSRTSRYVRLRGVPARGM